MKSIRSKKVWTDAYDKVTKQLDDLEVLNEFHEAGDTSEEELIRIVKSGLGTRAIDAAAAEVRPGLV